MINTSTWLHLRIPFSFFLLPVYLFALSISASPHIYPAVLIFFILHLFLYPASNGFNSYFDKDEKSIGGLKDPPKVSLQLYYTSLVFDLVALLLSLFVNFYFLLSVLAYGLASKAYSHPSIRLKKLPVAGWLVTGFFQGFVIFLACVQGINQLPVHDLFQIPILFPAALSTILLWGSYPMTQIYQHDEDKKRGDITLSLKLGVNGTFVFTALVFGLANAGFIYYYYTYYSLKYAIIFQLLLMPVLIFFLYWFTQVQRDPGKANFQKAMQLNLISSLALNTIFSLFIFVPL